MIHEDWHDAAPDAPHQGTAGHFWPLGHDRGKHYFFTRRGGQVRSFNDRDLSSRANLLALAPIGYWQNRHPAKTEAFNINPAMNELIDMSYRAGVYDPDRIRGRGVWMDGDRVIAHLGHTLIADGEQYDPAGFDGRYRYECSAPLGVNASAEPLPVTEAAKLLQLCLACQWSDREHMGRLFAGWLVVAQVCGAMPWRPHIWITSEAGGGKTWIMDNIMRPVLGGMALPVQSKTTEPGLRGALGIDARPVVFDEAESQNPADRARMQQILDLARQASSEAGAAIIKGRAGGDGISRYMIRSCFAFCSINLGISQAADESRILPLTLDLSRDHAERAEQFARIREMHADTITPDFADRLLARTLQQIPNIRASAETFALAMTRAGASRRVGDTIGVLMAGAWSLRSNHAATPAEADALVATTPWVRSAMESTSVVPEWRQALDHLLQYRISFTNQNGRHDLIPVGELIEAADGRGGIPTGDAQQILARHGLKISNLEPKDRTTTKMLLVAYNSTDVPRMFDPTPWATGYRDTLARAPGATRPRRNYSVGSGSPGKCLAIPLEVLSSAPDTGV